MVINQCVSVAKSGISIKKMLKRPIDAELAAGVTRRVRLYELGSILGKAQGKRSFIEMLRI